MQSINIKYTKLCFAIVLSFSLLLSAVRFAPAAEAAPDVNSENKPYTYSVEITFGALSFVYDWGTWNTSEMRYKASDSSTNPAAGTEDRFPGWYGFDGESNLVSVKYLKTSADAGNSGLNVSLEYTNAKGMSGLTMDFYTDRELKMKANNDGNQYAFIVSANAPDANASATQIWLSLSGVPMMNDSQFQSPTLTAIGTLTFRLGRFTD